MATITDLSMYTGEDKSFTDTIMRPDGIAAQDITGWLLSFVVHAYGDPTNVYITKTIGSGISVPVPTNGQATVTLANADTKNMKPDLYQWYMQRNDSGNNAILSAGLFTLNAA